MQLFYFRRTIQILCAKMAAALLDFIYVAGGFEIHQQSQTEIIFHTHTPDLNQLLVLMGGRRRKGSLKSEDEKKIPFHAVSFQHNKRTFLPLLCHHSSRGWLYSGGWMLY